MKVIRVLTLVFILTMSILVAIQPTKAGASVLMPSYYNRPVLVAESTATVQPVTYIVKKGDSLAAISSQYKLTWQSLYCDNKVKIGSNPNVISPGERLTIPKGNITCKIALPAVEIVSSVKSDPTTDIVTSTASQEPAGTLQEYALELENGNEQEYSCLNSIIEAESSWNVYAENPSGAYGIPQALPGSKMSVAGSDWATNGYTQLKWMVDDYIPPVYGTSCDAWEFHLAHGYY